MVIIPSNSNVIILKKTLIGLIFFLITAVIFHQLGFRWNESTSYPKGLYKVITETNYKRGDLVLFCPPDSEILQIAVRRNYLRFGMCKGGFEPVIKRIVGLSGDHVSFADVISINHQRIPKTKVLSEDSLHRALPQLSDFILPPNSAFVISDHTPIRSFDSRYYGAIPLKNIIGRVRLLFSM